MKKGSQDRFPPLAFQGPERAKTRKPRHYDWSTLPPKDTLKLLRKVPPELIRQRACLTYSNEFLGRSKSLLATAFTDR